MTTLNLFDFYEKLYFHEVEAREHLTVRLQVPLALLISTIGLLGFMVQNLERDQVGIWAHSFFLTFLISTGFMLASGYHCIRSAWGYEYAMLPVATEWDAHHQQCVNLYANYQNCNDLVLDAMRLHIYNKYVECSSVNASINEARSFRYHMSIKFFIVGVIFGFLAFICFFIGALDKGSHPKPTDISVVTPVELKGMVMATQNPAPPPPPPPPPTRYVRDDKRPPPPPPVRGRKNGE